MLCDYLPTLNEGALVGLKNFGWNWNLLDELGDIV